MTAFSRAATPCRRCAGPRLDGVIRIADHRYDCSLNDAGRLRQGQAPSGGDATSSESARAGALLLPLPVGRSSVLAKRRFKT